MSFKQSNQIEEKIFYYLFPKISKNVNIETLRL